MQMLRPRSMPDRGVMLLLMACHSVLAAQGAYPHGPPLHTALQIDSRNNWGIVQRSRL